MKNLCFLLFFSITFSQAQIVNIPDVNFKNNLVNGYCVDTDDDGTPDATADLNDDGEIQESEALLVEALYFVNRDIVSIEGIEYFLNIKKFYSENNPITEVDLSQNTLLEELAINKGELMSLDLSNNPSLIRLECEENQITNLDISLNVNMERLYCQDNQISEIDVSHMSDLKTIDIGENELTTLDVSNNTKLNVLIADRNDLISLNMKNGRVPTSLGFFANYDLEYVCADLEEMDIVFAKLLQYSQEDIIYNSYCTFTQGGEYFTLKGKSRMDLDIDGCDMDDLPYANMRFNVTNNLEYAVYVADNSGDYYIPFDSGSHEITPVIESSPYFTVSPTFITVDFPSDGSPVIQDICVIPNGVFNDLEVVLIPVNFAIPGFEAFYKIIYKNKGTTILSGEVNLVYEDPFMDLVYANPAVDTQSANNLTWNFYDLEPFESKSIEFTMDLNTPMDSPPLTGASNLDYVVTINPLGDDETPEDNVFTLNQFVVNSADPNDKTCLQGEIILEENVGDFVHYLIRFENLGTANATNVIIKDVIDTDKFDVSTLLPVDASHNFITRIRETNIVEFIFEDIDLPFDDANNDGYIAFKIKTLPTLQIGDTFSNDAEIYFDFNYPITTNDFVTSIENNLSVDDNLISNISIYPNPVSDKVYITSPKNHIDKVIFYDINGRKLKRLILNENKSDFLVDLSDLTNGIYFIKLYSEKGDLTKKIIKH